jgi:hypothetical protein
LRFFLRSLARELIQASDESKPVFRIYRTGPASRLRVYVRSLPGTIPVF